MFFFLGKELEKRQEEKKEDISHYIQAIEQEYFWRFDFNYTALVMNNA